MLENLEHLNVDSKLIADLKEGDVDAFKMIYNKFFNKVFNFVNRFSIRIEDTEEIVQDVFLKLWDVRVKIDLNRNFDSLLYVIAQNLVIDKIRKHASEVNKLNAIKLIQKRNKPDNCTEQQIDYNELSEIISIMVDQLPTKRRAVFKLSREKGFTNKEIADLMKVSQGTVEKQMSRALHTLTTKLKSRFGMMVDLMILILCFNA